MTQRSLCICHWKQSVLQMILWCTWVDLATWTCHKATCFMLIWTKAKSWAPLRHPLSLSSTGTCCRMLVASSQNLYCTNVLLEGGGTLYRFIKNTPLQSTTRLSDTPDISLGIKSSSIFCWWVKRVILLRWSYSMRAGVGGVGVGGLFPKDKMLENWYCCCYIGSGQENLAKKNNNNNK